jgi:flagellar hook-associated protein 3 FlgL
MRLSEQSRLNSQISYLSQATERMDTIQRQLSTNKKIQRASDDPSGTAQSLRYREDIAFEAQMRRNVENGTAFLNVTESALSGATDLLQRARELTVQASNGTLGAQEKAGVGTEIDQILQQMAQIGNTKFGDAYIFSGHQTQQPAYVVTGQPPTVINYQGDTGQRVRRISQQDTVSSNVIGSDAFGNIMNQLISLRDNLKNGAPATTINPSLADIDTALNNVLNVRADVGARLNRFEATSSRSADKDINLQEMRAGIEDIDLAETIVSMTAQQNALQAALGAIGRTSNMSLLNFLR